MRDRDLILHVALSLAKGAVPPDPELARFLRLIRCSSVARAVEERIENGSEQSLLRATVPKKSVSIQRDTSSQEEYVACAVSGLTYAPVRTEEPDDFTRIRGITPQFAEKLYAEGVTRFEQIAKWDTYDIDRFEYLLFVRAPVYVQCDIIERENWVGQAKILAGAHPSVRSVHPGIALPG